MVGDAAIILTYRVLTFKYPEVVPLNRHLFDILLMVKCVAKAGVDCFIVYEFLTTFNYFLRLKMERNELTSTNKRVVLMVIAFLVVYFLCAFASWNISWTLLNVSFFNLSPSGKLVTRFLVQPIGYTLDVIIFSGLLYIFHYQGRLVLKREKLSRARFSTLQRTFEKRETEIEFISS